MVPTSWPTRLDHLLRRLDRRLHIDHSGRSEWIWAVPAAGFVVTLGMIVGADLMAGAGFAPALLAGLLLGVPLGAIMAGFSIAYMTPAEGRADGPDDDGHRPPEDGPPPTGPPGWWAGMWAGDDAPPPPVPREPAAASRPRAAAG